METGEKLSVRVATVTIGDFELVVHVLDNGQRVIEADSFRRFVDWLEHNDAIDVTYIQEAVKKA